MLLGKVYIESTDMVVSLLKLNQYSFKNPAKNLYEYTHGAAQFLETKYHIPESKLEVV